MGKLAIISDLHVDINKFGESELMQLWQVLQKHKITRLHLAGDTANKVDRCLAVVEFSSIKDYLRHFISAITSWQMCPMNR